MLRTSEAASPPLPRSKDKDMAPVLPPKEQKPKENVNSGVVFPKWLHERIGEIATERGYSRNEVIIFFLKWALQEHERETAGSAAAPTTAEKPARKK